MALKKLEKGVELDGGWWMKYGGIIIFIKRNSDVNTGDLKILHKKISK